jgi:hypothetical protein
VSGTLIGRRQKGEEKTEFTICFFGPVEISCDGMHGGRPCAYSAYGYFCKRESGLQGGGKYLSSVLPAQSFASDRKVSF